MSARAEYPAVLHRRLLAAAISIVLSAGVGVATAGPVPTPVDAQQERDATALVSVPATPSCTETLMTHDFQNSYNAPFNGSYAPPAQCPGPWAKVVLTLTSTVGGVQFDRDVYVAIGGAVLLDGTTSEPCCSPTGTDVTWTVQRDVTDITPLLMSSQPVPVQVELDNVNDATYTGVYHTTVSLTFYTTDAKTPVGAHPDRVWPISSDSPNGPMLSIAKDGATVGRDVTFPADLTRLSAEVFADAHGPCEEFWWADPFDCVGTPYREIAVYVDGKLAGAAPAYPVIYTGASGPGLWEPIPSPRAWNIRPYDLDLTPFVGLLADGQPHSIRLGVFGTQLQGGDFWQLAANLQGWIDDPGVPTVGRLLVAKASAQPTQDQSDPTGQGVPYTDIASHNLLFSGEATVHGQLVTTTVTESMGEDDTQAGGDDGSWTWNYSTSRDVDGHDTTTSAQQAWGVVSDILTSYHLTESGTTSTTVDGNRTGWTSYAEAMDTHDATGLAFNGVEHESYGYADSSGACLDRQLVGVAGEAVENVDGSLCPGPPS